MPKRSDIKSILIIGSGPTIIGQGSEFDCAITECCDALKSNGYAVIIIEPNPSTITTDPDVAQKTYIEPLTLQSVTKVIKKEKPDAIIPTFGGQTAINLTYELHKKGIIEKYKISLLGVNIENLIRGEDRVEFNDTIKSLDIERPKSKPASTAKEATEIAGEIGYPIVIRSSFTHGSTSGGLIFNKEELESVIANRLLNNPGEQILVEKSLMGWDEFEIEMVRDKEGSSIVVGAIEYMDPVGIHSGDSIAVTPVVTIDDSIEKKLKEYSIAIADSISIEGSLNIKYAYNRKTNEIVVIEFNSRFTRSSQFLSRATGFSIAYISTLFYCGITKNEAGIEKGSDLSDGLISHSAIRYPVWDFNKFPDVKDSLGTRMKSTGAVIGLGMNFKEAFQKALQSVGTTNQRFAHISEFEELPIEDLMVLLSNPSSLRPYILFEAIKRGADLDTLGERTHIHSKFLHQIKDLAEIAQKIQEAKDSGISKDDMAKAKEYGLSDKYLAYLTGKTEGEVREMRISLGLLENWGEIKSFHSDGSIRFSTYGKGENRLSNESKKIIILGGGPNRIGQGSEFDYCSVHGAQAFKSAGYEAIIVNCNLDSISTLYNGSGTIYLEPLTIERIKSIYDNEKPEGIIVQFGGDYCLEVMKELAHLNINVLGTSIDSVNNIKDITNRNTILEKLDIPYPEQGIAKDKEEALEKASTIGYPVIAHPRGNQNEIISELLHDEESFEQYINSGKNLFRKGLLYIEKYLDNSISLETDVLSDSESIFIPSIIQHIELAGVHSGDSALAIPPIDLDKKQSSTVIDYSKRIAQECNIKGIFNIKFAIWEKKIYVLQIIPRASRNIPILTKVTNIPIIEYASEIILGKKVKDLKLKIPNLKHYSVKESVFPFDIFPNVDPLLGPEMRSTGEVLGLGDSFGKAYIKAQEATMQRYPMEGSALLTVNPKDRQKTLQIAKALKKLGFKIIATEGLHRYLAENKVESEEVYKLYQGRPHIVDRIKNNEINIIINTPSGKMSEHDDSYIRKAAIRYKIPYVTTLAGAFAIVKGIEAVKEKGSDTLSLQAYLKKIT